MKIFIAGVSTETNTFSPFPTGYNSYASEYLVHKGQHPEEFLKSSTPTMIFRRRAEALGWTVVESLFASAQPAGKTVRKVYEAFRDEILADLSAALPVDAVFFPLHGAMVADGYDDCEGDLISRARQIVGADVPIGVELDPHCHMTPLMVENATCMILEKEYPHTDFAERADEVFTIIADTLAGKVKPHTSLFDCRMIGIYQTTRQPMRAFVDRIMALEGKDGVLSISVAHGFPWGDVPGMGTKILVITDNQPEKGAALAEQLGRELYDLRFELRPKYLTIDEALDRALAVTLQPGKPVVIADVTDNPGGGTPGDSTFLLRALIERGITNVALGIMYDPMAVALAQDAGEGARLEMRIGGKMGVTSGDPLDVTADVLKVGDLTQHFGVGGSLVPMEMGASALIRANGIDIVLVSKRNQVYGTDFFTNMGVDLTQKRFVIVKSSQHFYAAFSPIATEVIYCAPPGALQPDLTKVAYKRIDMNKFPVVDNPWG